MIAPGRLPEKQCVLRELSQEGWTEEVHALKKLIDKPPHFINIVSVSAFFSACFCLILDLITNWLLYLSNIQSVCHLLGCTLVNISQILRYEECGEQCRHALYVSEVTWVN